MLKTLRLSYSLPGSRNRETRVYALLRRGDPGWPLENLEINLRIVVDLPRSSPMHLGIFHGQC